MFFLHEHLYIYRHTHTHTPHLTVMVFLKLGSSFSMFKNLVISSKMRRTSAFKLSTVRTSLLMLMAGVRELVSASIRSAR